MNQQVPKAIIAVVSESLASYYTHSKLTNLFFENGANGEPPDGNKVDKCTAWLSRCNTDPSINPFKVLGQILEVFMETDQLASYPPHAELHLSNRDRIHNILAKYNFRYQTGGVILGATSGMPSRTLNEILACGDLESLEHEFHRALDSIESDPAAGLTASCAIIESLCKVYIEDENLLLTSDQSIKPLWKIVSKHLGFDPLSIIDDDIKRILSGLTSVVDGLGALRTHRGTAHGQGRKPYKIEARHARLATHAAHTLCVFVIETWNSRKKAKK